MIDYSSVLSERVQELSPSGIRKFFDLASEMEGVISLGVGEPDFKTPYSIRRAGIESLEKGRTWYTANAGLKELKVEITNYLRRRFELDYNPADEVIVTVGGSEAIDLAIRSLINLGDEVLVPEPCFVAYAPIAALTGAKVVPIPTREEDDFKLCAAALKERITDKSKLLIFPYPNNPTGAVMRQKELEEIAGVLRDTNIIVLSDEIYAELTYGERRHVSIASIEGMRERTILVSGFSKAYAMTGWRIGYVCAPAPITAQMLKVHQYAIMCSPTTSQYAAVTAMRSCDDEIRKMADEYDVRRRLCVGEFNRIGLHCFPAEGAFYVFPSIKSTGMSSDEFCQELLYSKRVAVVPGTAFGAAGEGYVRVSYSYSVSYLVNAIKRIEEFLQERKG